MADRGSVADISDKLGEYMLKGWVLTEQSCKSAGCSVPLLRSPNGRTPVAHLCVQCDDEPGVPRPKSGATINTYDSVSSVASDSHISRSSTPPTEISSALSSPVFAPPADTEETRRRREQSDTASSEIGKRLLKGWAMLGDECPNIRCYGVPLVRPPKAGGEKDPRKECVICGGVYVTEVDWAGRERLIPTVSDSLQPANDSTVTISTSPTQDRAQAPHTFHGPTTPTSSAPLIAPTSTSTLTAYPAPSVLSNPLEALEGSSLALQSTLHALSTRLVTLSSPQVVVDPLSIGLTADAISKVTQALTQIRQLQWSESQAQQL